MIGSWTQFVLEVNCLLKLCILFYLVLQLIQKIVSMNSCFSRMKQVEKMEKLLKEVGENSVDIAFYKKLTYSFKWVIFHNVRNCQFIFYQLVATSKALKIYIFSFLSELRLLFSACAVFQLFRWPCRKTASEVDWGLTHPNLFLYFHSLLFLIPVILHKLKTCIEA